MKRGFSATPTPTPHEWSGCLDFTLIPERRIVPENVDEFDGYYYGVVLVRACSTRPQLVGATVNARIHHLLSCTPYVVYRARVCALTSNSPPLLIVKKSDPPCQVLALKERVDAVDLMHLTCELKQACFEESPYLSAHVERIMKVDVIPHASLLPPGALASLVGVVTTCNNGITNTDAGRLPHASVLYEYLLGPTYEPKQVRVFSRLDATKLATLRTLLCTTPWELVWNAPLRTVHKLRPLREALYYKALTEFRLTPPTHVQLALKIFFDMYRKREVDKHTLFVKSTYSTTFPCIALEARRELERLTYEYLCGGVEGRVVCVNPGGEDGASPLFESLALWEDHQDAQSALASLERFRGNAFLSSDPELRGLQVPQLFPPLTERQHEIATRVRSHWLTVVEGLPGTGKTSLITWTFSHYKRVMLTSFVGMMVKSLQKRNGRRPEVAHTIHHLLAVAKYTPGAREWLAWFEVLVVDEFSNVSMHLFAKLLALFPNVRKLVLVGDHRQLKPIECGDPMGDIVGAFGSHLLRDNLRVVPGLRALQEAPALIAAGEAVRVVFTVSGPLTLVPKCGDTIIHTLFHQILALRDGHKLMNTHIVLLLNSTSDGRHAINRAAEDAWIRLGVLKPPTNSRARVEVRYGLSLYPGCKITFLKNYNKPISVTFNGVPKKVVCTSAPVANGELAVVRSIEHCKNPARGITLLVSDEDDEDPEYKRVWIDSAEGIHPSHVDLGYATTTYKTQGREFPYVVFWNRTDPHDHWTRPHAYVAVSRGKERVWVVGERSEFLRVCSQVDTRRRTVFAALLKESPCAREPTLVCAEPAPMAAWTELVMLTDKKKPCVYTLQEAVEKREKREKGKGKQ
jgi:hypothetical protein